MSNPTIIECKSTKDLPRDAWGYGHMPLGLARDKHATAKRGPVDTVYIFRGAVYLPMHGQPVSEGMGE